MNVDLNTWGAIVGILVGVVTIMSAMVIALRWVIRSVVGAELQDNTRATRQVLHQVQNSHSTNLRADIDEVMDASRQARAAAADAKRLAAQASEAIHRTERTLADHVAFGQDLITAHDRRTAVLEQAVSDLSSAIKSVSNSTPLAPPEET